MFASLFACLICYCLFSRFSSSTRVCVCVCALYFLFSRFMEKRLEPFASSCSPSFPISLSLWQFCNARVFMPNPKWEEKQSTHTADTFCTQHFEPNLMPPPSFSALKTKKKTMPSRRRKKPKLPDKRLLLLLLLNHLNVFFFILNIPRYFERNAPNCRELLQ